MKVKSCGAGTSFPAQSAAPQAAPGNLGAAGRLPLLECSHPVMHIAQGTKARGHRSSSGSSNHFWSNNSCPSRRTRVNENLGLWQLAAALRPHSSQGKPAKRRQGAAPHTYFRSSSSCPYGAPTCMKGARSGCRFARRAEVHFPMWTYRIRPIFSTGWKACSVPAGRDTSPQPLNPNPCLGMATTDQYSWLKQLSCG